MVMEWGWLPGELLRLGVPEDSIFGTLFDKKGSKGMKPISLLNYFFQKSFPLDLLKNRTKLEGRCKCIELSLVGVPPAQLGSTYLVIMELVQHQNSPQHPSISSTRRVPNFLVHPLRHTPSSQGYQR